MDSGNSASMQSSSGGDEADFDSRGGTGETSFSSFLNINNLHNFNPQQFLTQQSQNQNPTTFFDPQNHFSHENNNLLWSTNSTTSTRSSRSTHHDQPNYPNFTHQSMPTTTTTISTTTTQLGGGPNSLSPYPGPSQAAHASSDLLQNNNINNKLSNVIKNPKKRTRASRRAPTTVLTTDTTNFRQMVQEFTGIPAAPFTGNSAASSYSRRLDLYSAASALRSGAYLDSLGPLYPLRPAKGLMDHHNVYGTGVATSSSNNNNNNNANNNNYNQQLPLMNLQQQLHSSGGGTMNFGNLMSGGVGAGGGASTFHQSTTQEIVRNNNNNNINDGVEENFVDGNLNISNKNPTQGNVASWNYPSD